MPEAQLDAVTGAFSYSGASIAQELHTRGHRVRTLTGHPGRATAGPVIDVRLLQFSDPVGLRHALEGVETLYNTYWVRTPRHGTTFDQAVDNSTVLFRAAADAGVHRIVHVSITNPDLTSPYPYFRGKAQVEEELKRVGVPHAIVRPSFLFGRGDVLVNNIGWMLRHLPVVAIGDGGGYVLRGIHVADLAALCADLGAADHLHDSHSHDTSWVTVDAVGPERLTFRELVEILRRAVGARARLVDVPGWIFPPLVATVGFALGDTILTRDEYRALAAGLADSTAPTTGQTRLTAWAARNGDSIGRRYVNDARRHEPQDPGVGVQP